MRDLVAPQDILVSLTMVRGDSRHLKEAAKVDYLTHPKLPRGQIYTGITPRRHARVKPNPLTLVLRLNPNSASLTIDARALLTPALLRDYLLAWALALDADRDGQFALDEERIADLLKRPRRLHTDGRRRLSQNYMAAIRRNMGALESIYVCRIGDVQAGAPEPLLNHWRVKEGPISWRQANAAWLAATKWNANRFAQVPRAVLALGARDVPMALGLARLWREHITSTLVGPGHFASTLERLAEELGEDVQAGIRDRGASQYFERCADRLAAIAREADLGAVRVVGHGPGAEVRLTPSATLATAYDSMVRKYRAHAARETVRNEPVAVRREERRASQGGGHVGPYVIEL